MENTIERYTRVETNVLGRGGMGIVYKAFDTLHKQWVAQKIMTGFPEDAELDQKARERFEREVKIAQELKHPHILPAIDAGYTFYQGRWLPFLVSPYLPDGSLARFMKQYPPCARWSLVQTADVIRQAAEGLQYMHNQNPPKVHQDVKPANFLLRYVGRPDRIAHIYLSDFGITREQRTPLDIASEVIVSFHFMAPEQVDKKITPASDQYSLAVIACLLLTGELPFRASSDTAFARAHLGTSPTPPSQLNPARVTTSEIDNIILRALSKKPEDRFPSIEAFAKKLQGVIKRQIGPDTITEVFSISQEETRRGEQQADIASFPATPAPSSENPIFEPVPLDPLTHYVGKQSPPEEAASALLGDSSATERQKVSLVQQSFKPVLSKELPQRPRMLHWSADGNILLCTFFTHPPLMIARNGKTERLDALRNIRAACWSPQGHLLAVSIPNTVRGESYSLLQVWNVDDPTQPLFSLPFQTREIEAMDWSLQRQLSFWVEQQVLVYALPERIPPAFQPVVTRTLTTRAMFCGNVGTLRWSPDGAWLAAGARDGALICWHGQTYTAHLHIPASNHLIYSLAWSPDSRLLAIAFRDQRIEVWNVPEKRRITQWQQVSFVPRMLSISINNRLVAASNTNALLFGNLQARNLDGTYPGHWLAAWSPTRPEFATLDAQTGTDLILWEEAPTNSTRA